MEEELHERPSGENREGHTEAGSEQDHPRLVPRIYAASLSDYNSGRVYGKWIDANQEADELAADIQAMLDASPTPGAEEWAVHDFEGFGPARLSEYETLPTISRVARGIAEHGPAFAHWAALVGIDDADELDRFEEAYLAHAESVEAYAEELLDELGYVQLIEQAVPEHLQPYVTLSVEGFARDLELSGDITTSEGDGGVYVFDPRN